MAQNPQTYTGKDANIKIATKSHSVLGISDFSLTIDRGTVEQELVGETGNYFVAGSMSIDGSLTACKLENSAAGELLKSMITGSYVVVSGSCGDNSLHFYFKSAAITGFDISIGDADTITEGSIDFTVMNPHQVTFSVLPDGGTVIQDV